MSGTPSWVVIVTAITPVAAGLGGYWLSGRNDDARDQRTAAREEAARLAARGERRDDRRHEFQRTTLLELQDELQRQARVSGRALIHDRSMVREHGQLTLLPEGLSDEAYTIGVSIRRLQERVLDEQVRNAVADFKLFCDSMDARVVFWKEMQPDEIIADIDAQAQELSRRFNDLMTIFGTALRDELDR
jgi:hypothetical protein